MAQLAIEHAKKAGVDGTVVNGSLSKVYSTRFANSAIHQNFTSYTTSLAINVIKGKKLTNMRAAGSDDNAKVAPKIVFSLEESMEYIKDDEYLEITPKNLRMRKIA